LLNTAPVAAGPKTGIQPAMLGGGPGGGGSDGPSLSLCVAYNGKTSVTLTGKVNDSTASVAGLTVTFTGKVAGSATTDANGNFTYTADASGLGNISALTSDANGYSNTATVTLAVPPPTIVGFACSESTGQEFTFTGSVGAQTAAGLTVTFGGIPSLSGQTATVAANGLFQLFVQLKNDGSDNGTATAQTTDWWGQVSNIATISVHVS
jgi:hypothetical protein